MKELNNTDYRELTDLTNKLEYDIKDKDSNWYNNRKNYLIEFKMMSFPIQKINLM